MATKKKHEFRDRDYSRNSEGLKQRRLKEETRWKFNPNQETADDLLEEEDWSHDWEQDSR